MCARGGLARSNRAAHVNNIERRFMTKIDHVTVHHDDGEQRQRERALCAAFVLFFAGNW